MTTPTISDYLKYANLQMAAEAFIRDPDTNALNASGDDLIRVLKAGNKHASRFTQTEAEKFESEWKVVDQRANTATGFSGTLFINTKTDELVLSFRSTEFIDDATRDCEATNKLEIGDHGFALGQLADMEEWYKSLKVDGVPLSQKQFSVTGYSLGGHLATAFNLMHGLDSYNGQKVLQNVITFNGAGVGKIGDGSLPTMQVQLPNMIQRFSELRTQSEQPDGMVGLLKSQIGQDLYRGLKAELAATGGVVTNAVSLYLIGAAAASTSLLTFFDAGNDYALLTQAVERALKVTNEATRAPKLSSGSSEPGPRDVPDSDIAAETLDYQLAVLTTTKEYQTSALSIVPGGVGNIWFGKTMASGATSITNQYDLVGTETTTTPTGMVSNSQYHYGVDEHLFVEDQPLFRGTAVSSATLTSFANAGVKLLSEGYANNDFGDTHSLVLIVDSLNIQNTLKTLDPSVSTGTLNNILKAASSAKAENVSGAQGKAEGDVLENILNALGKLVLGTSATQLKAKMDGNTWAKIEDRTTFYNLLEDIAGKEAGGTYKNKVFKSLIGNVTVGVPESGVLSEVRNNFINFLSVLNLSPVMFRVADGAKGEVETALASVWGDEHAKWQADQALTSEQRAAGQGNYTDTFLYDRARLIGWRAQANIENKTAISDGMPNQWVVEERNYQGASEFLPLSLDINGGILGLTGNAQKMIFGKDGGTDDLAGGDKDDHLYGMGGDDRIVGNGGNDHLEGGLGNDSLKGGEGQDTLLAGAGDDILTGGKGADTLNGGLGNDTYLFTSGDGWDTITDSDGKGHIEYDGITLDGGQAVGDTGMVWQQVLNKDTAAEKTFTYILTDWMENGETYQRLSIEGPDGGMFINNWKPGDLGITLPGAQAPKPLPTISSAKFLVTDGSTWSDQPFYLVRQASGP